MATSGSNTNGNHTVEEKSCEPEGNTLLDNVEIFAHEQPTSEQVADIDNVEITAEHIRSFEKAIFVDDKWDKAIACMQTQEKWGPPMAKAVLREGAKKFGIWALSDEAVEGPANVLLNRPDKISPSLATWCTSNRLSSPTATPRATKIGTSCTSTSSVANYVVTAGSQETRASITQDTVKTYLKEKEAKRRRMSMLDVSDWRAMLVETDTVRKMQVGLAIMIFIISNAYAIKVVTQMYPDAVKMFGWPIYFARMGGMGAACWTAVLYFTMSRGFLTFMYNARWPNYMVAPFDAHKDLHVFAGMAMVFTGAVHTLAHICGTVPGILTHSLDELNNVFGCSNKDKTPNYLGVSINALQWPQCPLKDVPRAGASIIFGTTPGLTGVLLVLLLWLTAYTGSATARKHNFDRFWYVHNLMLMCWPVLLFLHGSNGWLGVGFPLVVFTSSLPLVLYAVDRLLRVVRYVCFAGRAVHIVQAIIRPGTSNDSLKGAFTYLRIGRPPFLWNYLPGMYAFICMPEYAPLQWHPFTICSGVQDDTVDFLIAAVGDWTQELAAKCQAAKDGTGTLPKVALDGPYLAPTQSALCKKVLIAVGAGVGITPFFSLMSTIIGLLKDDDDDGRKSHRQLEEAHFFWMTRSVDEFLFGRRLFSEIVQNSVLQRKVILHLHTTAQTPDKDPMAFVFRESVKRQSQIDREVFMDIITRDSIARAKYLYRAETPWCWVNGAKHDVLWVDHLASSPQSKTKDKRSGVQSLRWPACAAATLEDLASKKDLNQEKPRVNKLTSTPTSDIDNLGDTLIPIVFGRPDFAVEVRSIGKAHRGKNVHVYVCANDVVVQSLQDVCQLCNERAEKDHLERAVAKQRYFVHYERFG